MPTRVVTIWISATYLALVDIAVSAAINVSYIKRVSLLSFSLTVRARSTVLKDGLCHSLLCFSRSHPFCSRKLPGWNWRWAFMKGENCLILIN